MRASEDGNVRSGPQADFVPFAMRVVHDVRRRINRNEKLTQFHFSASGLSRHRCGPRQGPRLPPLWRDGRIGSYRSIKSYSCWQVGAGADPHRPHSRGGPNGLIVLALARVWMPDTSSSSLGRHSHGCPTTGHVVPARATEAVRNTSATVSGASTVVARSGLESPRPTKQRSLL